MQNVELCSHMGLCTLPPAKLDVTGIMHYFTYAFIENPNNVTIVF